MTPQICPNCGAPVPRRAKACARCGADEKTGWSESAQSADLGLPDEKFDYDKFAKEEFGKQAKPRGIHWIWWLTAALLAGLFLFFWFR